MQELNTQKYLISILLIKNDLDTQTFLVLTKDK